MSMLHSLVYYDYANGDMVQRMQITSNILDFELNYSFILSLLLTFFSFMRTRFFRLYPLHIFMLLVFLIIECGKFLAFRYGGFSFTNYPFTGAASPYELVPNILLIQSWAPSFDHLSFNFPSWSISVEFYVYAIFFLTISIFRRVRLVSWLSLIILSLYMLIDSCAFITAQALKGIFCFFLGAVIYKLYLYFDGEINFGYIFSTVIEFLLLCISIFVVAIEFNSKALFVPFLFSLVVFFYSLELGYFSSLLKWSGFQWLGKLSYSIYMTHAAMLFIIISMAIVLQKLLGHPIAPMVDAIRFIDFGLA